MMKLPFCLFLCAFLCPVQRASAAEPESLPAGTSVTSISVTPESILLDSPYAYHQVVATAVLSDGNVVDVTRLADITLTGDCARVDGYGFVQPVKDGEGSLQVQLQGKSASANITCSDTEERFHPDYVRDVMPVVSRLGCNAGTCHGAKDGKNGFKLSLRGYDPIYDIRAFTDDLGSRRINRAAPDSSLMLLKATGAVPHEGGRITTIDTDAYKTIRDWIADGAKLDLGTPKVKGIEVFPLNPVVQKIGSMQQMRVVATYVDGTTRDVTREAFVESGNAEVAEPEKGAIALIRTVRRGEAPILVRYEGNYAATTVTVMGDRSGFAWQQPEANNRIDELVAEKWQRMKILPSGLCDDYEFVRRVHLDLTGLPPDPKVVRKFVKDTRPEKMKRSQMVDSLIGSESYIDHWANKWADMLMVNRKFLGTEGALSLRNWIRREVKANTPYDEFVYNIITASGSNKNTPQAGYFKILRTPEDLMENTTHLFLATRFNCNKCHDHPFERWTQDQYYEMAAYFAQIDLRKDPASGDKKIGGSAVEGAKPLYEIIADSSNGEVKHERTGAITEPSFPYPAAFELAGDKTRREQLADWITAPENRYFASSYVNRLWGYMLGTGIIEPLDDIRAGNPPSNPELLAFLEKEFIDSGFDVRHVLGLICKSRTYQLSIATNKWNQDDTVNFSHGQAKRLPAEVLFDTIYTALGAQPKIPGVKPGTRAAQLPDVGVKLPDGFLDNAGRPVRESSCECERSSGLQLGPIMALVSGPTVGNAISDSGNILPKMVKATEDDSKLTNELFMRLLSRPATKDELQVSREMMATIETEHTQLVTARDARQAELQKEITQAENERATLITTAKLALDGRLAEVAETENKADAAHKKNLQQAEKSVKDFEAQLPQKLAQWESSSARDTSWQSTTPLAFAADNGALLQLKDDQSILASGPNGRGKYRIYATTELKDITGIRLEALPDDSLPKKGPGRADNDGNFVLTEFDVFTSMTPQKKQWQVVKLWNFNEPGNIEGWDGIAELDHNVEDGALKLASKGNDPRLNTKVKAPAGGFVLEMRAELPGDGIAHPQLFWTTKKDGKISESKSTRITIKRGHKGWKMFRFYFHSDDEITSLRLDPLHDKRDIFIDALRLIRSDLIKPERVSLHNARASFSQKGYDVAGAIDGKRPGKNSGWGIAPQMGKTHIATFQTKDLPAAEGRRLLRFDLYQQFEGNNWSLGRFRLAVTSSPAPFNIGMPEDIKAIVAKTKDQRSDEDKKKLEKHFRDNSSELTALQTTLTNAKKPRQRDAKLVELEGKLKEAEKPVPVDPLLARLRKDVDLSEQQKNNKRLTAAQDIAWAIINTPAFLFNR